LTIDDLLKPFEQFGVRLGLEAIQLLLQNLSDPQDQVPIIHVTGSNGKGSVCAYLSSVLVAAGFQVGRYTSPHLVDWTERISLNNQPISTADLEQVLQEVIDTAQGQDPAPTQFEVLTAAAWLYFAQHQVDIAIMEVGLGGRLDATNVCDYPLVSVITSISREHWQRLGPTLGDIAREKAGILKPEGYAVIGPLPPEAASVVYRRAAELNCVTVYPPAAIDLGDSWAEYRGIEEYEVEEPDATDDPDDRSYVHLLRSIRYQLPLQGKIQLQNSALAIAALQILREQGWQISDEAIIEGIAKTQWPGRLQWFEWSGDRILIDGAHNPASAEVLRQFVDTYAKGLYRHHPTHWVMGMLSTKDHADIFQALLRPHNHLYLVPVPDHSSADPEQLANLAREVCPELASCTVYPDEMAALTAALHQKKPRELVVLCGSLYLIGHFLKLAREGP
jgi:dihydrofolate synthase / folylpolyglutamate synthase